MLLSLLFYKLGNQGWVRLSDSPKITASSGAKSVNVGFLTLDFSFFPLTFNCIFMNKIRIEKIVMWHLQDSLPSRSLNLPRIVKKKKQKQTNSKTNMVSMVGFYIPKS